MTRFRLRLRNCTQYSDQVCGIRLGIDHIISSRAHWRGDWDRGAENHSYVGPLQCGKYTVAEAGENCPIFRWL